MSDNHVIDIREQVARASHLNPNFIMRLSLLLFAELVLTLKDVARALSGEAIKNL
jgi:hypothetical protein